MLTIEDPTKLIYDGDKDKRAALASANRWRKKKDDCNQIRTTK